MSDEVEKFVLQYNVELKDSVQRLNDLADKIEKTNKAGEEGAEKIGSSVKGAVGHLEKMIPGLKTVHETADKAGTVFKGWIPGIAGATVALTTFAYAMKQVNIMREEYNAQRETAWKTGNSVIGVEQSQRELIASSGGKLNGAQSRSLMENIQGKLQESYTDPNPANETNLRLRMAGTSAYGKNGQIKSSTDALDEIGKKMRSVSQEQANAIGQTLGLTQNETAALRNRNEALVQSQKLTAEEVTRRVAANAAMESLNSSFGSIDESFRRTGNVIAEEFLPVFADVMKVISDWLSGLPGNVETAIKAFSLFNKTFELFMQDIQDPKKVLTGQVSWEKSQQQAAEIIAKQNAVAKEAADKQNLAAQTQKETAANNEKSIRLFSQSVNTMAGVVDEQQAWAAWAGSVGKAGGLSGIGEGAAGVANASGGGNGNQFGGYSIPPAGAGASTQFNTGNIRSSEGGFRKYNNFEEGVQGHANQLMRYYDGKTTGRKLQTINDIISTWAPSNENKTHEYIDYMKNKMGVLPNQKLNFGDSQVLGKFMYYQAIMEKGKDKLNGMTMKDFQDAAAKGHSGMNPANSQAISSVYSSESMNNSHAETKNTVRLNEIFSSVAGYIGGGMTAGQIRNGGARKSDIKWGLDKDLFESERSVNTLRSQVASPQLEKNKAEYANQLLRAEQHLQALRTNYNTVLGAGTGSEGDARSITMQRPEFNFFITGANDPHATAKEVKAQFGGQVDDMVNNTNSAVSN